MLTLNFSPNYERHLAYLAKQEQMSIEQFVIKHLPPMPVDFDMERMEQALNSGFVEMPSGLSLEEKRAHILATARKYREEQS